MSFQRRPEHAAGSIDARRPGVADDLRADQSAPIGATTEAVLDRMLELLERRRLSPAELRILVAARDGEVAVSTLEEDLGRPPAEIRRAAARLYARGLIRWRDSRDPEDTVFAITPGGLATLRPLLTAPGHAALAGMR